MTMFSEQNSVLRQAYMRRAFGWPRPAHESPERQQAEARAQAVLAEMPKAERAQTFKDYRSLLVHQLQVAVHDLHMDTILAHDRNATGAEVEAMLWREFPEVMVMGKPQAKPRRPGVVYLDGARKVASA